MKFRSALPTFFEGNPLLTGGFPSQWGSNAELWCSVCCQLSKLLDRQSSCRWFDSPCDGDPSLVPHLIGTLLIGSPTHWSPNTLLELIGPQSHRSPVSLVPYFIGPPFHKAPRQSHWFPISLVPFSLVPQLISPPIHYWNSLVPNLIGPQSHWSPISLVPFFIRHPVNLIGPPSHWSHLIGSLLIGPQIHKSPTAFFELIGHPSDWSPFSLNPFWEVHFGPIPLVPHLIDLRTAQVYWDANFLVSQEVYLNSHHFCG